jgi:hypothetical protein
LSAIFWSRGVFDVFSSCPVPSWTSQPGTRGNSEPGSHCQARLLARRLRARGRSHRLHHLLRGSAPLAQSEQRVLATASQVHVLFRCDVGAPTPNSACMCSGMRIRNGSPGLLADRRKPAPGPGHHHQPGNDVQETVRRPQRDRGRRRVGGPGGQQAAAVGAAAIKTEHELVDVFG